MTVDDLTELRIKVVDEIYNDWQKLAENLQFTEDCVQHIMQQVVKRRSNTPNIFRNSLSRVEFLYQLKCVVIDCWQLSYCTLFAEGV